MKFRSDINGLRAIAVLLVMLFHFNAPYSRGGFIGVDIFFVISGFLMTRIILEGLRENSFSLLAFYHARAVRIIPALVVVVTAVLALGFAFIDPEALSIAAKHGASALLFVSNILFWTETGYFDSDSNAKWFLHTWSLSVEWMFYLAYPLALLACRRLIRTPRSQYVLLGATLLLSLALSIMAGLHPSARAQSFGFFMLPTRAWEMLAGGLVAIRPDLLEKLAPRKRWILEHVGLAGIVLSLAIFTERAAWPSYNAILPVAATALVLLAKAPRSWLSWKPLQTIGLASYSIYLWHWPLRVALTYFEKTGAEWRAAAFVASLALGWLSYRWVERASHAWLKTRPKRSGVAMIASSVLVLVGGATSIVLANGLTARVAGDRALYEEATRADDDHTFPSGRCGGLSPRDGTLRFCVVGAPSKAQDVIILGDSFAEMWFSRAEVLAPRLTDHAVVFATKSGCPPVPGVERIEPGFNCKAYQRAAFREALKPRYETVVIASMWTSHFRTGARSVMVDDKVAVRRLGDEISRLRAAGKTVVLVRTVPYPGINTTLEIKTRTFQGKAIDPNWSFSFAKTRAEAPALANAFRDLARQGVIVIDPATEFCINDRCPILNQGRPIYSDGGHLRSSFMASHLDILDPALLDRLG